jgi:hypothetical protein
MIMAPGRIAAAIGVRGFIAIALAIALAVCWWGWSSAAEKRDELAATVKLQDAEITLLRVDAGLKETAAEERQADTAAIAAAEKDLVDEIQSIPDTQPDAVRVALGCARLRRAGGVDADLPAVCRPGTGS